MYRMNEAQTTSIVMSPMPAKGMVIVCNREDDTCKKAYDSSRSEAASNKPLTKAVPRFCFTAKRPP